ncbi:hypothetical protein [Stetteria hydrogenophila]
MSGQQRRRKGMTLPKKKEDLEKIVEEVEESHGGHGHHHHHAADFDELLTVFELLIDSLNASVKNLESQVKVQAAETARLYRVLAKIVEACFSKDEASKRRALMEAISIMK